MNSEHHHENDPLTPLRHSAAHVMAEAVLSFFPDAKLAIGPVIEDGFYYDFLLPRALTPDDLEPIENKMREIIQQKSDFERSVITKTEATEMFANQPFKLEIINNIEDETVSLYTQHTFTDLCEGPHVANTADIKAFKLLRVAGAYWRGDETKEQLQRIYGTAFTKAKDLKIHLMALEEAEKRDHRKLGRDLDLFMFDAIAPASPFFLPKGALIYGLLINYMRDLYAKHGYDEVITPQIFSTDLWKQSGHYESYLENMFFIDIDDREFGVKPMNCPAAAMLYASQTHSYRELPIRYADFGRLHRYERSGVVHGLTRVRSFSQDDAHIFCRFGQIQDEIREFVHMLMASYKTFGFEDITIYLSMRPEKRVGNSEMWDQAEQILEETLNSLSIPFEVMSGEGAFYGPKIDFFVKDALRRDWQLGTIQLDFSLPERFDLQYATEEGTLERPVVLHRALLGSLERFLGILLEHTGGALPTWLSPTQATVIPIADRHIDYAKDLTRKIKDFDIRVEMDDGNERMNAKIRKAQLQKIPYMLIVGDQEIETNTVSVRQRNGENLGSTEFNEFISLARDNIESKNVELRGPD
ncbi:threonine--tRNA ligase [Dehalococcoidia bacterium]|nr:threonine--tRNA ligase [Dehalococcoidia bacterium]